MKTITPSLLRFAAITLLLTILFRYALSYGIENDSNITITFAAVSYAAAMFAAGYFWGRKDWEFLPIYDIGFRFHLTTYLVHNIVSELWFWTGFNAKDESITVVHYTALIWGIIVLIHFVFFLQTRKNAIHNLDKEDLFD